MRQPHLRVAFLPLGPITLKSLKLKPAWTLPRLWEASRAVFELLAILKSGAGLLPDLARQALLLIARMIDAPSVPIRNIEIELIAWHRKSPASQRLETIPGSGFITATALAATVTEARAFRSGPQFAAWLGLAPRQNSSGGKDRLGGISKMRDRYLRHLLIVGATALVRYTRREATTIGIWANRLLERKPAKLVTVAAHGRKRGVTSGSGGGPGTGRQSRGE